MSRQIEQMLSQEIFSALAFAYLIGLICFANYLTHHINVEVLTAKNEVSSLLPHSL